MIITAMNAKGGAGKTTVSVNLAIALEKLGNKILFIDMDMQSNASLALHVKGRNHKNDLSKLLLKQCSLEDTIVEAHSIHLVPSNPVQMLGIESQLAQVEMADFALSEQLEGKTDEYDFVIIDCPPSLGRLVSNPLLASDAYFIPLIPEPFYVTGLVELGAFAKKLKKYNPKLDFLGYVLSRYNPRKRNLTHEEAIGYLEGTGQYIFKTHIRESKVLYDSIKNGIFAVEMETQNKAGDDFISLAQEFVKIVSNNKVVA